MYDLFRTYPINIYKLGSDISDSQISIFTEKGHLEYGNQTVSSNSDFYHEKSRRESFDAICANMTVKQYHLRNDLNNKWDEKEKRDDLELLELEGELWKKMFLQYASIEEEEEGGDDNECEEENIVDDNVDDGKESEQEADGDEDGVAELFGEDSDTDDFNHESLKLPGATSDGEEGGEGSSSGDESMHKEGV